MERKGIKALISDVIVPAIWGILSLGIFAAFAYWVLWKGGIWLWDAFKDNEQAFAAFVVKSIFIVIGVAFSVGAFLIVRLVKDEYARGMISRNFQLLKLSQVALQGIYGKAKS